MASLAGYVIDVDADLSRNLDRQERNLWKIKGVEQVEFYGVPGGGSYWRLLWSPARGQTLSKVLSACDRAIQRARKTRPGDTFDPHGAFSRDSDHTFLSLGGYIAPGRINEITKGV